VNVAASSRFYRAFWVVQLLAAAFMIWSLFLAPADMRLARWSAGAMLVTLGTGWTVWPEAYPIAHPFGVRLGGIFILAVTAVITIYQFVTE
jgi:hypothetical protein